MEKMISDSGQIVLEVTVQPLQHSEDEPEEEPGLLAVALDVAAADAARFPDPIQLILFVDIDVPDESEEEEADRLLRLLIECVETCIDENHIAILGELEEAVLIGIIVFDAKERSTGNQIASYEQFSQLLDADLIIDGLLEIVSCTDLTDEDLGETWGITLRPEENVLARVNAGDRVLAEVWQSGRGLVFRIMVIGAFEIPGFIGDSAFLSPGFEKIEGSMMVSVLSEHLFDLLDIPGVADRIADHAEIGGRKLSRTNWHNPMSEIFFTRKD